MKAKLLYTPNNPIDTMYVAARTCYSERTPEGIKGLLEGKEYGEKKKLVKAVLDMGHWSIAEQVSYTMTFENIPRSISHQLVRHRPSAYAQQSQRYVKPTVDNIEVAKEETIPPKVKEIPEIKEHYDKLIDEIAMTYEKIYEQILEKEISKGTPEGIAKETAQENARIVLPNAWPTNLTATKNLRQITHECSVRLCERAQDTTRYLYQQLANEIIEDFPMMKNYLKPKCYKFKLCDEGKKSCGKFPTI